MNWEALIRTLDREHRLSGEAWERLFTEYTQSDADFAIELARQRTLERFGRKIWFRGIVEFSNICKCDCHYCGIRCSNHNVSRYRLSPEDIFECCAEGYGAGSGPSSSRAARTAGSPTKECAPSSGRSKINGPTAP